MTKNEFLEGLRKALGNDLDRETVQENVAYYVSRTRQTPSHFII